MWEKLYKTLHGFWIKNREKKKEKRNRWKKKFLKKGRKKGRLGRKSKVIKERRKERQTRKKE